MGGTFKSRTGHGRATARYPLPARAPVMPPYAPAAAATEGLVRDELLAVGLLQVRAQPRRAADSGPDAPRGASKWLTRTPNAAPLRSLRAKKALEGSKKPGEPGALEALGTAIEKASWLNGTPGEPRQKLRHAKKKYRALLEVAAKRIAEGLGDAGAKPSSHAKDAYDPEEYEELKTGYESLKWKLIRKPGGQSVKYEAYYRLYGLHMQAEQGDNATDRPEWAEKGGIDFAGRAKWDAWKALAGKSREDAKHDFVKEFYEFSSDALFQDTR